MVHHVIKGQDGSLKLVRTYLGNDDIFELVYAGVFYYVVIYALPVILLAAMTYRHNLYISASLLTLTSRLRFYLLPCLLFKPRFCGSGLIFALPVQNSSPLQQV